MQGKTSVQSHTSSQIYISITCYSVAQLNHHLYHHYTYIIPYRSSVGWRSVGVGEGFCTFRPSSKPLSACLRSCCKRTFHCASSGWVLPSWLFDLGDLFTVFLLVKWDKMTWSYVKPWLIKLFLSGVRILHLFSVPIFRQTFIVLFLFFLYAALHLQCISWMLLPVLRKMFLKIWGVFLCFLNMQWICPYLA